jgi:hypothetical protein
VRGARLRRRGRRAEHGSMGASPLGIVAPGRRVSTMPRASCRRMLLARRRIRVCRNRPDSRRAHSRACGRRHDRSGRTDRGAIGHTRDAFGESRGSRGATVQAPISWSSVIPRSLR